jgi:hypothetical protein
MTPDGIGAEIRSIVAEAAELPLADAAYCVWRQRYRLDTLEGRPTAEQVRIYRAMSPTEQAAKLRYDRDHAQDGPTFAHLKTAHPRASDLDIKQAISGAVKFEDACFKYFVKDSTDYWQRCVRAVALAARENPGYLEITHQLARNDVAYYMK